ncbi:MAG: 50S ribosomal protein L24 [Candidatus Omnitrophica bacterium]|nr:50S ribosomal protein L24 [Candidatus Omnitrophota bacterium]
MVARIRRNDTVFVRTGKDVGKKGKVLRMSPKEGRILVEGVNVVKKHMRPTRDNPKGGIVTVERPVQMSNVMLVCPRCSKPTRIGMKHLTDGTKKRICKKCQEII